MASSCSAISREIRAVESSSNLSLLSHFVAELQLKVDFHSAENIARSTFPAHFLLNCSN